MGTMYIEQDMYSTDGQVCETIMIQNNKTEDGSMWILRPVSFRVIGLFESQIQGSIVILTNQSIASTIQMPYVANVKLEHDDNIVCVLLYYDDNICATVDLSDTSSLLLKITPFQVPLHASKSSCSSLYRKFVCHDTPSQLLSLHPSSSSIGLITIKFTKYRKSSKSYLIATNFENIIVRDVKFLPSSFNGDMLFVLPLMPLGVLSAYGRSRDGMDKMCDGHLWCTTKTTNIQNDFGLVF